MVRILGIDPGTAIVGWGIINHDPQRSSNMPIAYGHIETSAASSDVERLAEIASGLAEIITTYEPHEVSIEALFYFKNAKTIITVAQARGVILHTCFAHDLAISEYTPLQVKQSLTGYGRATKNQMQEAVKNMLKLKHVPQPDDTADALAIALCHSGSRKYLQTINSHAYA